MEKSAGSYGIDDSDAKRDRVLREALGCRVELVAYARAVLGNYTAAEDVVQEAMRIEMRSKLPSAPFDLIVESFWCHTLDEQAGLEIAEVELIPPARNELR